jgi:thymidylate kinase
MKYVFFEGADCTGKSSAVKAASEFLTEKGLNVGTIHFGPIHAARSGRAFFDAMHNQIEIAAKNKDVTLVDRCWLSEPIYGALRGKVRSTPELRAGIESYYQSKGSFVILCNPPLLEVLKVYNTRKEIEMLSDPNQLARVYLEYLDVETDLPMVTYDWTTDNILDLFSWAPIK